MSTIDDFTIKETLNCTDEQFFDLITDYLRYPKIFSQVKKTKIQKETKTSKEVYYKINMIKDYEYVLNIKEVPNKKMSWTLKESDLFSKNTASWTIKPLKTGGIEVTYKVSLKFKIPMPKILLNSLVKKEVPKVIDIMKKEVKRKYG